MSTSVIILIPAMQTESIISPSVMGVTDPVLVKLVEEICNVATETETNGFYSEGKPTTGVS